MPGADVNATGGRDADVLEETLKAADAESKTVLDTVTGSIESCAELVRTPLTHAVAVASALMESGADALAEEVEDTVTDTVAALDAVGDGCALAVTTALRDAAAVRDSRGLVPTVDVAVAVAVAVAQLEAVAALEPDAAEEELGEPVADGDRNADALDDALRDALEEVDAELLPEGEDPLDSDAELDRVRRDTVAALERVALPDARERTGESVAAGEALALPVGHAVALPDVTIVAEDDAQRDVEALASMRLAEGATEVLNKTLGDALADRSALPEKDDDGEPERDGLTREGAPVGLGETRVVRVPLRCATLEGVTSSGEPDAGADTDAMDIVAPLDAAALPLPDPDDEPLLEL